MKIYLKTNVLDAALDRFRYLFDEFPEVVVGFSGGKDSTVILNLALQIAEEKGRLPLKVMFIDQEAEWEAVIEYVRRVMSDPRIKPMWFQIPFKIENATSTTETFLNCWDPNRRKDWMREYEPGSIRNNIYSVDHWNDLFHNIPRVHFPNTPMCFLSGVRAEESMTRMIGLTHASTYKHITYGKVLSRERSHYTFYPLYDWSYTDIWKAIHSNKWDYCSLYDSYFQYGIPIRDMRVSNVNHETAVRSLYFLQEIEPHTWNKLANRLHGVKMAGSLKKDAFTTIKELPPMFESWREYRDYLAEHLLKDPDVREKFATKFAQMDKQYDTYPDQDEMHRAQITGILANDHLMTKIKNWEKSPQRHLYRKMKKDPTLKIYTGTYADALKKDTE
jgi:predicted phosphoadenosine phosphosulfate sulfurtransferase